MQHYTHIHTLWPETAHFDCITMIVFGQYLEQSLLQVGLKAKKVRLLVSTNAGTHNESGGKTICCINLLFCPPLSAARTQGTVTLSPTPFFPPKL